eukprot:TRINITY_DN531_c0_g1_i2.p1 TRINITY_DN531_c0_g1~~TRINITY_DN531_c0_g1_i2.p1  ORF type:complete len:200 (-),score=31.69 TRINITY_DN531_c0_g1_i2:548-1147(-)
MHQYGLPMGPLVPPGGPPPMPMGPGRGAPIYPVNMPPGPNMSFIHPPGPGRPPGMGMHPFPPAHVGKIPYVPSGGPPIPLPPGVSPNNMMFSPIPMHGMTVLPSPLLPTPPLPNTKLPPGLEDKNTTVYVGKICPAISDEFMKKLLEQNGGVAEWRRVIDPSGQPKGFGFCDFVNADGALRSLRLLNGLLLGDRELMVT